MDTVKSRIRRIAKILKVVCVIARVLCVLLMAATIAQIAFVYIQPDKAHYVQNMLGQSEFFESLDLNESLKLLPPMHRKAIEQAITLIELGVLLFYANIFKRLMARIVEDEQPFTFPTAKTIRKTAFAMLLMMLHNPVMGGMMFLITLFFSYVFEYGAYLQEKADKTSRIQEEVIVSLAEITENKSEQTGQHIRRVSEYSRILATQLGYSEEAAQNLRLASTMHDLGKLMIPSEILDKPGKLTDAEFSVIKKHPGYGEHLLHNVEGDTMTLAREVALEHHERYDGKGYPSGLSGEDISLDGRIVAVADVYDALTSRRSYKEAWDPQRAYDEIVKGSGTQFDAKVVDAFKAAYDEIDATRRKYADGEPAAA